MKRTFITLFNLVFTIPFFAQTLTDGDVLFTYVYSDSDKDFAIIALKNLAPNEVIYFTDNALLENGDFATNEGSLKWTSPDSIIPKGTIIDFFESSSQYSASVGSVQKLASFTLSTTGDQILAYQANDVDTVFLAAINWGTKTSWISTGIPSTAQSYLPNGLTAHLDFGVHRDNGVFNCPSTKVTSGELKNLLLSVDNWTLNDDRVLTPCYSIQISDPITNINEGNDFQQLFVYPNPSLDGKINFSEKLHHVKIFSLDGKELLQYAETANLDLSNLEQGTYLLISDELKEKIVLE